MKRRRKIVFGLCTLLLCFICTLNLAAASAKLNIRKKTIKVGQTYQLKVTGTSKKITWSVKDSSIATVNSKGRVTGKKAGTTTVFAKFGKQKLSCKIIVKNLTKAQQKEQNFVNSYKAAKQTNQLIIVQYESGSNATLSFHQKQDGLWTKVLSTYAYVGKNGIDKQKEGDKKTPTGTFDIKQAFGIKSNPGTTLPYTKLTSSMYWCEDKEYYNTLVDTSKVKHKDCSGEHLIYYAGSYDYSMVIDYNSDCVYGKGSAIFLHCTKSNSYTAGCIAIPKTKMVELLKKAKPGIKIVIG